MVINMVRGCQKRIYFIKNPDGEYFEEVYFVLKNTAPERGRESRNLASEADRIIRDAMKTKTPHSSTEDADRRLSRAAAFALGAVSSSAVIGTVAMVVSVL